MSLTKKIGLFVAASMALVSVTAVQAGGKKEYWRVFAICIARDYQRSRR